MAQPRDDMEGMSLPSAHVIPEFESKHEERDWWATHDTSALPGEDVQLRPSRKRGRLVRALTVRTDQETLDRLKRLADKRADYHEIARRWLQERLGHDATAQQGGYQPEGGALGAQPAAGAALPHPLHAPPR